MLFQGAFVVSDTSDLYVLKDNILKMHLHQIKNIILSKLKGSFMSRIIETYLDIY